MPAAFHSPARWPGQHTLVAAPPGCTAGPPGCCESAAARVGWGPVCTAQWLGRATRRCVGARAQHADQWQQITTTPHQTSNLNGKRAEAEDGIAGAVRGKVHQRAKGVTRPPVVHAAHDCTEVRKLSLLDQVADCRQMGPGQCRGRAGAENGRGDVRAAG